MARVLLLAMALSVASGAAWAATSAPATACDTLAASPDDLDLPAGVEGVPFSDLDPSDRALQACFKASGEHPNERRYLTHLGRLYAKRGENRKALEAYRLAYGRGSAVAANNLGAMYQSGRGVPRDERRATRYYRTAAHRGLPFAMRTMGARARTGFGMSRNPEMAVFWYRRAAEVGDAVGMHDLGKMYQFGLGVREDDERAFDLLSQALARDPKYALAAYNIAAAYETGEGVGVNLESALAYYTFAAENGDGDGANEVGRFYADGLSVERDPVAAAEWYARGAAQGSMAATVSLADAYQDGLGVGANEDEARRLYQVALDYDPNDEWRAYIDERINALPAADTPGEPQATN